MWEDREFFYILNSWNSFPFSSWSTGLMHIIYSIACLTNISVINSSGNVLRPCRGVVVHLNELWKCLKILGMYLNQKLIPIDRIKVSGSPLRNLKRSFSSFPTLSRWFPCSIRLLAHLVTHQKGLQFFGWGKWADAKKVQNSTSILISTPWEFTFLL